MSASEHHVTQTKNLPKVSVVITCFDLGAYLEEALESIAQYPITEHYEVVIVDDGSTDPLTLRVLSGLDSERYRIIRQQNMGLAKARNNGIRAAKGSYIIVLDADNRLRPAMFSHTIACLDADPSVDVVYGDLEYFDGKSRKMIIGGYDFGRLLRGNYIDACAGFRKSLWERLGGYDEHMPLMGFEDWDLWLRASVSGARFHYVNEVLFDYRVRKGSMLANANMSRSLLVDHLFNKPELRFLRDLRAEYYALHEAERTREVLTGRVLLRLLIQRLKDRFTGSVGEGTKRKTG